MQGFGNFCYNCHAYGMGFYRTDFGLCTDTNFGLQPAVIYYCESWYMNVTKTMKKAIRI